MEVRDPEAENSSIRIATALAIGPHDEGGSPDLNDRLDTSRATRNFSLPAIQLGIRLCGIRANKQNETALRRVRHALAQQSVTH